MAKGELKIGGYSHILDFIILSFGFLQRTKYGELGA
jgi:hypothetical protein